MKNWGDRAGWAAIVIVSVTVVACSDDGDGTSGAGGSTSDGGAGAGGDAAGGQSAGGQSAGGNGQGGDLTDPACGAPLTAPSAGACALTGGVLPPQFACNPVTNEGCNANEACDISGMTGFACYTDNTANLCQPCDQQDPSGPFCTEGTTCFRPDGTMSLGSCARYCCDDGDCGGGTCVKTAAGSAWFVQAPDIGVCLE